MPAAAPLSAHARALARAAAFLASDATTHLNERDASATRSSDGASGREARKARPNVRFLGNALRAIASANARAEVNRARVPVRETSSQTREEGGAGEERDAGGGGGERKRRREWKRTRREREERRGDKGRKRTKSALVKSDELTDGEEEEGEIRASSV